MGTREMTSIKNGRKNGTRNIENTKRKWNERIENITRRKTANQESTERRWIEKIANIMENRIIVTTIDVRITTSIVDTENAPMTKIVIT
jgi:hypothetical protein